MAYVVIVLKLFQFFGIWMYAQLRRRGNLVILWVPNEVSEFGKIKNNWRVNGFMTDYPTKLRKWIEDYKRIEDHYSV